MEKTKCTGCGADVSPATTMATAGLPNVRTYCAACTGRMLGEEPPTAEDVEEFAREYVAPRRAKYGPMTYKVERREDGTFTLHVQRVKQ